jgi:NADH:ubiquinone oxidoreductase subunit F (NADH-binding)
MERKGAERERVLEELHHKGGLRKGVSSEVHKETGVPEADIYGVATFYHLLSDPDAGVRVCQGLSCHMAGSTGAMEKLESEGTKACFASCLGRCDMAPALWDPDDEPPLAQCHLSPTSDAHAIDLAAPEHGDYEALDVARDRGGAWVVEQLESSGVTGRGGAGFPAHIKWSAIRKQAETERYIVLNADEGEPGTFKDREVILRRPHLVAEGLAIAAHALEASDIYCYVRGEFGAVKRVLVAAVEEARERNWLDDSVNWHFVDGHGAYICGEETALLEALEGKRGMPRMKPPFPVEKGFRNKPTLIQNVETIACVPAILRRGGEWFQDAGGTQPGSKLYCMSGHIQRPGVYEAPMGVTMRELIDMAGGVVGELKAFSPGGASSGFLPADQVDVAMDFKALGEAGSMLGSAGVVILNDTVDMVDAALNQAVFFEDESCGQCAPCRIGARMLKRSLDRYLDTGDASALEHTEDVAWEMVEGSICGLGYSAPLPLQTAMKHFPEAFAARGTK